MNSREFAEKWVSEFWPQYVTAAEMSMPSLLVELMDEALLKRPVREVPRATPELAHEFSKWLKLLPAPKAALLDLQSILKWQDWREALEESGDEAYVAGELAVYNAVEGSLAPRMGKWIVSQCHPFLRQRREANPIEAVKIEADTVGKRQPLYTTCITVGIEGKPTTKAAEVLVRKLMRAFKRYGIHEAEHVVLWLTRDPQERIFVTVMDNSEGTDEPDLAEEMEAVVREVV